MWKVTKEGGGVQPISFGNLNPILICQLTNFDLVNFFSGHEESEVDQLRRIHGRGDRGRRKARPPGEKDFLFTSLKTRFPC